MSIYARSVDVWPRAAFFPSPMGGDDGPFEALVDDSTARSLCEAWRQRCCLDEARFAERLSSEGFDVRSFGGVLAAREALRDAPPVTRAARAPDWQSVLTEVLDDWDALSLRDRDLDDGGAPFTPGLHPFLAHALGIIDRSIPSIPGLSLREPSLRAALYRELARRLDTACRRVLVLELHVARVEERLEGESAEARFRHYGRLLRQRAEWEKLFSEYQVMARAIATHVTRFSEAVTELLARLADDFHDLSGLLLPDRLPLRLVDARGGVSDLHRSGRSVWILDFAGEEGAGARSQIVYKPRSLAVDACFHRLVAWVVARIDDGSLVARVRGEPRPFPRFRILRTLPRGDHGWVELAVAEGCASREAVERFYLRQGGYLALLYLLRGVDLHYENLMACGEDPVLVDLETLFHADEPVAADDSAASVAIERLRASVVRIGLLPNMIFGDAEQGGANMSGLGDGAPQPAPFLGVSWERAGTDEMELVPRARTLAAAQNVPRVGGEPVPVTAHADALVEGFEAMYRLLWEHREALCAPGGLLDAFSGVEVRHVLRATLTYARFLGDAGHPDNQRDAADVEALLDLLWLVDRHKTQIHRIIPSERRDLREGDVPLFVTRPGSCDLWDSRGQRIPGYFATDGVAEVKKRFHGFTEEDLHFQIWLIRASLATLRPGHRQSASRHLCAGPSPQPERLGGDLVAEASRIGDKLLASAIVSPDDVTWIGVGLGGRDQWSLAPVGADLYDGTSGIALFLGYLGHVTGEPRFSATARRIATSLVASARRRDEGTPARSGLLGEAAELYALACLSRLWGEPALLVDACAKLGRFASPPEGRVHADVVSGEAGTILGLLTVHRVGGGRDALALAVARADALCAASNGDFASLWPPGEPPLLGFSHGSAGIACALFALAHALEADGRRRDAAPYRALAELARAFERERFDREAANWPRLQRGVEDLPESRGSDMIAWCHGAAGVALGRSLTLGPEDPEARREIEVAVRTTLDRGLGKSHILCHGDLGSLMIVARAADALDRDDWRAEVARHVARIAGEIRSGGPEFASGRDDVSPGLFCGLAGVGYGLLYHACPRELPLVLGLAPPEGPISDRHRA